MGCMLEEDSWMVRKDNKATARDRGAKTKTGRLSSAGSRQVRMEPTSEARGYN